jgi:hypothetical protein
MTSFFFRCFAGKTAETTELNSFFRLTEDESGPDDLGPVIPQETRGLARRPGRDSSLVLEMTGRASQLVIPST